jgi:serine/threonine protein kinase
VIGTTIDRYHVVEKIGQGGMGVIYRAQDTLLGRSVALKVLPSDRILDHERRERFLLEAKSASALNHPGIVTVYDVLNIDGQDVLVMELVEGRTLEEVLAGKRLGLGQALTLAIGIADALAQAHAAGIVHRDLKPANIMVTADGIKVLDFGLAKLMEAPFSDAEAPTMAPDESSLTSERAVLGTIAWMSPEQTVGGTVDSRSDIFAFGVLLYEMLTGRHPFRRDTMIETVGAIRSEEPEPLTSHAPALPPEAQRAVTRCLRKEPGKRWQSLTDLGAVLEDLKEDTESGRQVVPGHPAQRRTVSWATVGVVAALIAITASAAFFVLRGKSAAPAPLEIHRLTYDAGTSMLPAISPDGNLVAFSSDRAGEDGFDIWVRHINQPEPTRLTTHPSDDWSPRFSPDGSRIVFISGRDGGGIFVLNALGGGLRRVAARGIFPQFSPDGASIIYAANPDWAPGGLRPMFRVPVNGGPMEPFLPGWGAIRPPGCIGPIFSPDGELFIFSGAPLDDPRRHDWWVAPVGGGEPWSSGLSDAIPQIDIVQFPAIWLQDRLILLAGTTFEGINLFSVGISDRGLLSGPATPLTAGPGMSWMPTISDGGRIAFSRFSWVIHLWEVGLDPETGKAEGPAQRITDDGAPKFAFSLTENGDKLAYSTYAGQPGARRGELVIQDRATGQRTVAVTLSKAAVTTSLFPRLSADGSMMSWMSRLDDQTVSWVAPVSDPTGRELCRGCWVVDFFADGKHALVDWGRRLSKLNLDDGEESPVLELDDRALLDTDLSRDNRWLAVQIGETDGTVAIYLVPVTEEPVSHNDWIRIAGGDGWVGAPRWSTDQNTLYYISDRDDFLCVWGRSLDPATKIPIGDEFPIVHAHTSAMKMMPMSRQMWSLEVGGDRLVFNAGEMTGDVYTAQLESAR